MKTIFAALAAAAILTGCAIFGTSKAERVMRLETDLNESRQFAYQNFDPDIADYLTLATQNPIYTWNVWFPPAEWPEATLYSITVKDTSADSLTATVDGPVDFGGPRTLTVGLVRIGMDWYIDRLELSGYALPIVD
jgi:hypothetical protein